MVNGRPENKYPSSSCVFEISNLNGFALVAGKNGYI